ncbi:hypothetical protein LSH36_304g08000 [Paralvinella palmiformis]|uniref:Hflx-type G domain-containing protein n=1 Tax=Paralvinella palmiformis TaxID=53620 RepID=A0AAD9JIC3_9ANNE|nr:hypothetical protein LSH36_304g08000 [Paralvinella palmiformis]
MATEPKRSVHGTRNVTHQVMRNRSAQSFLRTKAIDSSQLSGKSRMWKNAEDVANCTISRTKYYSRRISNCVLLEDGRCGLVQFFVLNIQSIVVFAVMLLRVKETEYPLSAGKHLQPVMHVSNRGRSNPSLLSVRGTKRNGHLVRRHTSTLIGINSPTAAGCYLSGDRHRGRLLWSNARNVYTTCQLYGRDDDSSDDMDSDEAVDDDDYELDSPLNSSSDLYEDQYLNPLQGHRVMIIHPAIKSRRYSDESSPQLADECQLVEACSLIDALPEWTIVGKEIVQVPQLDKSHFFSKGVFYHVQSLVGQSVQKTAVFVNFSILSGLQLAKLQRVWRVPVYDRYTIILQIFHLRARTMEAKLQLKLAEIPYYRSRLRGMHIGTLDQQKGGLSYIGGSGETWMDTRYRIMAEKELSIRKKLDSLKKKRHLLWRERKKKELPLVAVVGYTNAGKTSLIRALARDSNLQPWDQVFATLDVTCHAGYLGNHMKVVYMDTVGFISNIPTNLIDSFSATLEDVSRADAIIHVKDISHPSVEIHRTTVMETLTKLKLDPSLLETIIEVNNKVDIVTGMVPHPCYDVKSCNEISRNSLALPKINHKAEIPYKCNPGEGLPRLIDRLEDVLMKRTGRVEKRLKIPQAGPHLAWLYKEATVRDCQPFDDDNESLLVSVVMTTASYDRFCAQFSNRKRKKDGI